MCRGQQGSASNLNYTRVLIGYTDSLRICVMVRGESAANGFTYDKRTKECFAITDAKFINHRDTCCESCIFDKGKI